jgi:hypothetical protein
LTLADHIQVVVDQAAQVAAAQVAAEIIMYLRSNHND